MAFTSLAAFCVSVILQQAQAKTENPTDDILFGPEFTFSSEEMLQNQPPLRTFVHSYHYRLNHCNNPAIKASRLKMLEAWDSRAKIAKQIAIRKGDPTAVDHPPVRLSSQAFSHELRWVLASNTGATYWLGVDPAVLEMGTLPMTAAEFHKHSGEIQNVIFDTASDIGLTPQLFTGGGHINIGTYGFRNNRRLLLNFIVDFYNHPELSMGVFGYDTNNAINLRMVDPHLKILRRSVEALRQSEIDKYSYKIFVEILSDGLLAHEKDPYHSFWLAQRGISQTFQPRYNNVALEVRNPTDTPENIRLEFRAVRPQATAKMFARQVELLRARMRYLEQLKANLELEDEPIPLIKARTLEENIYDPPIDPQLALARFHQYVTESGLNWSDYQDFIWPKWVTDGELERFNQRLKIETHTSQSKKKRSRNDCASLLHNDSDDL